MSDDHIRSLVYSWLMIRRATFHWNSDTAHEHACLQNPTPLG